MLNKCNAERLVTCEVPQETVRGPVLFTIYLNNLFDIKTTGKVISFADDTAIVYNSSTWNDLKNAIQTDFLNI